MFSDHHLLGFALLSPPPVGIAVMEPTSSFDYWKDAGSDPGDLETNIQHPPIASTAAAPVGEDYNDAEFYAPTGFGEIGNFMRNKRRKLAVQLGDLRDTDVDATTRPQIFKGLAVYVSSRFLGGIGLELPILQINGYVAEGLQQLIKLLTLHGGTYVCTLSTS